jgi:hypothetical protein
MAFRIAEGFEYSPRLSADCSGQRPPRGEDLDKVMPVAPLHETNATFRASVSQGDG